MRVTRTLLLVAILGSVTGASCATYRFASNGERIYFTATSASGRAVSYTGSFMMMHPRSCVNCHGPSGKGGRVRNMMGSFEAPDITWDSLTQEAEHNAEGAEPDHEDHPPYTEGTLKRAITRGIDPEGKPLESIMPRWQMAESDLNDLVEFIKTLR